MYGVQNIFNVICHFICRLLTVKSTPGAVCILMATALNVGWPGVVCMNIYFFTHLNRHCHVLLKHTGVDCGDFGFYAVLWFLSLWKYKQMSLWKHCYKVRFKQIISPMDMTHICRINTPHSMCAYSHEPMMRRQVGTKNSYEVMMKIKIVKPFVWHTTWKKLANVAGDVIRTQNIWCLVVTLIYKHLSEIVYRYVTCWVWHE